MNHRVYAFVLGLCAAAALVAPAVAEPSGVGRIYTVSKTVRLGDVDLHTTDGAKVAAQRIQRAADYLCGGDQAFVRMSEEFASCRSASIDRALATLDAPLVSEALGRPTSTDMAAR
jgi:UrcA family protein